MINIYFLRHGESISNVNNTFSGLKDNTSLTAKGEEQARVAGANLKTSGIKIDRIIASPLHRAQKTAQIVAEVIGFDLSGIETDSRLAEYDMGELTGKPRTNVTSSQLIAAKGAEDPHKFMQRVERGLADLKDYQGTILIVSHAGVGKVHRCSEEDLDPKDFYDLPPYPNATVIQI